MWEVIGAIAGVGSLLWSIFSDNRAAEAAAEAAMWRGIFLFAVIVIITVLAFIIWREHSNNTQAIEKPEER